jgi:hypothetical protein
MLKERVGNNSRKSRDLLKNMHSGSLRKSQLALSQGMIKKGDVIVDADDDDDEVRNSVSQNRVTATLCTEDFFLSTQHI